jgi:Ca2+-binding RTX toxin-like protein
MLAATDNRSCSLGLFRLGLALVQRMLHLSMGEGKEARLMKSKALATIASVALVATFVGVQGADAATPTCYGKPVTIVGTTGPDTINGTNGSDVIVGLGGKDAIRGNGGDDLICAGLGNDGVGGGAGSDKINGGEDADTIGGGDGNDQLQGGPQPDSLSGGPGNDLLERSTGYGQFDLGAGGAGDDTIQTPIVTYENSPSPITYSTVTGIATGEGTDSLPGGSRKAFYGSNYGDDIYFDNDGTTVSWVYGLGGNDTIQALNQYGDLFVDVIVFGGSGSDLLIGPDPNPCWANSDPSDDVDVCGTLHFSGENGNDTIRPNGGNRAVGGPGADTLTGSQYSDLLYASDGVSGNDSVDGKDGEDTCTADAGDVVSDCEK